jgi:hypothetical protein
MLLQVVSVLLPLNAVIARSSTIVKFLEPLHARLIMKYPVSFSFHIAFKFVHAHVELRLIYTSDFRMGYSNGKSDSRVNRPYVHNSTKQICFAPDSGATAR